MSVTTVNGEVFTHTEAIDLSRLIYKRFGKDPEHAAAAWRRMLQNSTTVDDFLELVYSQTHTAHCDGECLLTNNH